MAEAFGAIAGAVQITDCVCRTIKILHGKYEAFSDADENVQRLRRTLKDFEIVAHNLRLYQAEHALSTAATVEHEVLPSVITKLEGCQAELDLLGRIADAAKPSSSISVGRVKKLGKRIRWVYDESKTTASLLRLERHKSSVLVALQTVDLLNNIKIRQGINDIKSGAVVHAQNVAASTEQSSRSVDALRDTVNRHDEQQTKTLTNLLIDQQRHSREFLAYSHDSLAHHREQVDLLQHVLTIVNRLGSLESEFAGCTISTESFRAETRASNLTADGFARLFRQQVRSVMPELKERLLFDARAEFRGWLREELDRLPQALEQTMHETGEHFSSDTARQEKQPNFPEDFVDERCTGALGARRPADLRTNPARQKMGHSEDISSSTRIFTSAAERKTWFFQWRFGRLRVSVARSSIAQVGTTSQNEVFEAKIEFIPTPLIFQRGVSLSYSSSTDLRGYVQRCPAISTFAVIPSGTGPFKCIQDGRIEDLKDLFNQRLAAPSDRDELGTTLLDWAIYKSDFDICECLLAVGADPSVTGLLGLNAMESYLNHIVFAGPLFGLPTGEGYSAIYRLLEPKLGGAVAYSDRIIPFWAGPRHYLQLQTSEDPNMDCEVPKGNYYCSPEALKRMQYLKDIGYDFNAKSGEYVFTPLMWAAQWCNSAIVQLLLIRKSSGCQSWGALHYLMVFPYHPERINIPTEFTRTAKLLIKAGCDISATNSDGITPSSWALNADVQNHEGFSGRFKLWTNALAECGIDIKDVLKWEMKEHAQSSATDWAATGTDSQLRRRRPIEQLGEDTPEED